MTGLVMGRVMGRMMGRVMGRVMGDTCVPSPALAPAQLLDPGASAVLVVRLEIMPVRQGQAHVRYM